MKLFLFICSGLLFLALAHLPLGYYTFLRIIITIASIAVIALEWDKKINFWIILFVILAVIFNPIIPIHLYHKSTWVGIDFVAGLIFGIKGLISISYKK